MLARASVAGLYSQVPQETAPPRQGVGMLARASVAALYSQMMPFPLHRKRRLRVSEPMRRLVRETHLAPSQLVLPLFTCPGEGVRREIGSMPGNFQLSID